MTDWLVLLALGLATARLTRLVVTDQISEPLRNWAYRRDPKMRHIGYLLSCPYCTGIWASAVVLTLAGAAWFWWGQPGGYAAAAPVAVLAVAQAALWLTPREESSAAMSMAWETETKHG